QAAQTSDFRLEKESLIENFAEAGISLDEVECSLIEKALKSANGNQTKAAKLLGISREKIKYRMKKFDIQYLANG
ncbi:MAG: helix-turn-helix domain-containing protein, partial [Candidatus Marinimicrobia bacterium]|nr:helix-turn-helix domain-containing protein [Candidatus Neomarinimicrobiota bacterium]